MHHLLYALHHLQRVDLLALTQPVLAILTKGLLCCAKSCSLCASRAAHTASPKPNKALAKGPCLFLPWSHMCSTPDVAREPILVWHTHLAYFLLVSGSA